MSMHPDPSVHPVPRPVVVTSQCLELSACRYNGETIRAPFITALAAHADLRPICPEVAIGLGVPRDPIRLVRLRDGPHLIQPSTGVDVTMQMEEFATRFLGAMHEVDGFILKSRSPSCGVRDTKHYGALASSQPTGSGPGMFGAAVMKRFPHAAVEDEGRLTNFRLRHHFLTKLFARAAFRAVRDSGSVAQLVQFHTAYKLLLMAQHQVALRRLGRIVAEATRSPFAAVADAYETDLSTAFAAPARVSAMINALLHAAGYFKSQLTSREKQHFSTLLERYNTGRVTLAAPLGLLRSWAERFDETYLAAQVVFQPYPPALLGLRDSGRGGRS